MSKVLSADKMRIQTLSEQGYGVNVIMSAYPQNYWKFSTVKKICDRVDQTGSAAEDKAGSVRPQSAHLDTNIVPVEELICSQEGQIGQHLSAREIAAKLHISDRSARRIAKKDLYCLNNATLLYVCSNVFECAKIARWHYCNTSNFKTVFKN